jgi:uncharacterized membrane protein YccC
MFPCPACGVRIAVRGEDQWFQCQYCGNWLCQRIGTNNRTWLDVGIQANGTFTVVFLNERQGQGSNLKRSIPPAENTSIEQLSLQDIQTERQTIAQQVQTLKENIQRVVDQMGQSRQDIGRITRLNSEITGYNRLQQTLTDRDAILETRETTLLEEQRQARRSTNNSTGAVFGCSIFIIIGALIAFSLYIHFTWNLSSAVVELFIALIGSVILALIPS